MKCALHGVFVVIVIVLIIVAFLCITMFDPPFRSKYKRSEVIYMISKYYGDVIADNSSHLDSSLKPEGLGASPYTFVAFTVHYSYFQKYLSNSTLLPIWSCSLHHPDIIDNYERNTDNERATLYFQYKIYQFDEVFNTDMNDLSFILVQDPNNLSSVVSAVDITSSPTLRVYGRFLRNE